MTVGGRPTGRLKVHMPAVAPSVRPKFSVLDKKMRLVTSARCEDDVELSPGTYVVSAAFPTGEKTLEAVEIRPGESEELWLETTATVETKRPAGAEEAEVSSTRRDLAEPPSRAVESLGPPSPPSAQPAAWFIRFFAFRGEGASPAEQPPSIVSEDADAGPDEADVAVVLEAARAEPTFAQIGVAGYVPVNVALPIAAGTRARTCRLTAYEVRGRLVAFVSLPHNETVDAIARYLHGGYLAEAAEVVGGAEGLLQAKLENPFRAALGGYALLRLGMLERLHDWPGNLARWFQWLADGAVIAGEQSARAGDHERAIAHVLDAATRGLPVFVDGFSLLLSRLLEYANAPEPREGVSQTAKRSAGMHVDRLLRYSPFIDFSRITLSFPGADVTDPAASQIPLDSAGREAAWQPLPSRSHEASRPSGARRA